MGRGLSSSVDDSELADGIAVTTTLNRTAIKARFTGGV
jgi:hypothetical protein